jgi:hypothetical protein
MHGGLVGRIGDIRRKTYSVVVLVLVVVVVVVQEPRGWSAVSSSLEPSPPTGHYCLVPYSVTNCFIKLKSHNPHCNASRRPCASTLPSTLYLRRVPFASRPLVYTRPHAASGRVRPPRRPCGRPGFSLLPSKIFSSFYFSDLIKT